MSSHSDILYAGDPVFWHGTSCNRSFHVALCGGAVGDTAIQYARNAVGRAARSCEAPVRRIVSYTATPPGTLFECPAASIIGKVGSKISPFGWSKVVARAERKPRYVYGEMVGVAHPPPYCMAAERQKMSNRRKYQQILQEAY